MSRELEKVNRALEAIADANEMKGSDAARGRQALAETLRELARNDPASVAGYARVQLPSERAGGNG